MLYYFIFFFPIFLYIFPTSIISKHYLEKWKISNKLLFLTIGHSYMEHNFFQMFLWTNCYSPYVTPLESFWLHHWIFEVNKVEDKAAIPLALGRVLSWWQMALVGLAKYLWKLMCSATLFLFLYGEKEEVREWLRERESGWGKAWDRVCGKKDKEKADCNSCSAYLKVLTWLLLTSQVTS